MKKSVAMKWIYALILCMLLSSCDSFGPSKKTTCDELVDAEDKRAALLQKQVDECIAARKTDNGPLLSKIAYGLIGIGVGVVVGSRLTK